jgi:hypothetical protein
MSTLVARRWPAWASDYSALATLRLLVSPRDAHLSSFIDDELSSTLDSVHGESDRGRRSRAVTAASRAQKEERLDGGRGSWSRRSPRKGLAQDARPVRPARGATGLDDHPATPRRSVAQGDAGDRSDLRAASGERVDGLMKPTYQVKVWPDDHWWLARVVDASSDADTTPLNALTQARSLAKIDPMARDLIATILDADEDAFDVDLVFELPTDVNELVGQARGAREWADAAQELWQERSAVAARALAQKGYSLRETATLLGLSHQRVDQILGRDAARELSDASVWLIEVKSSANVTGSHQWESSLPRDIDALLVLRNQAVHDHRSAVGYEELARQFEAWLRATLVEKAAQVRQESAPVEADSSATG